MMWWLTVGFGERTTSGMMLLILQRNSGDSDSKIGLSKPNETFSVSNSSGTRVCLFSRVALTVCWRSRPRWVSSLPFAWRTNAACTAGRPLSRTDVMWWGWGWSNTSIPAWRSLLNSWPEDVPFFDTWWRKKNDRSCLVLPTICYSLVRHLEDVMERPRRTCHVHTKKRWLHLILPDRKWHLVLYEDENAIGEKRHVKDDDHYASQRSASSKKMRLFFSQAQCLERDSPLADGDTVRGSRWMMCTIMQVVHDVCCLCACSTQWRHGELWTSAVQGTLLERESQWWSCFQICYWDGLAAVPAIWSDVKQIYCWLNRNMVFFVLKKTEHCSQLVK